MAAMTTNSNVPPAVPAAGKGKKPAPGKGGNPFAKKGAAPAGKGGPAKGKAPPFAKKGAPDPKTLKSMASSLKF